MKSNHLIIGAHLCLKKISGSFGF